MEAFCSRSGLVLICLRLFLARFGLFQSGGYKKNGSATRRFLPGGFRAARETQPARREACQACFLDFTSRILLATPCVFYIIRIIIRIGFARAFCALSRLSSLEGVL